MNKNVKEYLKRGLIFGGFGPIIVAIILAIISINEAVNLEGWQILVAVISTYIVAFVQAGSTVFNQIEHWSTGKSLLCHLSTLYVAYSLGYVANTWIPFEPKVLIIFTIIFMAIYFVVWGIVYFSIKATSKNFNAKLK